MRRNENRRNFLKTSALTGFAGLIAGLNPMKLFSEAKVTKKGKVKVVIHPEAVKRNKKG